MLLRQVYEVIYQVFTFFYRFVRVFSCVFFFSFVAYAIGLDYTWTAYIMIAAFFGGIVIALEEQGIFQFLIKRWRYKN